MLREQARKARSLIYAVAVTWHGFSIYAEVPILRSRLYRCIYRRWRICDNGNMAEDRADHSLRGKPGLPGCKRSNESLPDPHTSQ